MLGSSRRIYFVTGNRHKYLEVKPIAEKYGFELVQRTHGKLEIQSDNLLEIARYAALSIYRELGEPVLVEDAGLFIDALNGFPGPYSSYVYRTIGINGVLKLMNGIGDRRACFRSVAVLLYEPFILTGYGEVCGVIALKPRGGGGFGFDPIFIPRGSSKTFAEMSIDEKNKYSHRAKSVEEVFSRLNKLLSLVD
jgi:XTP/dITP diphosphohydrolase